MPTVTSLARTAAAGSLLALALSHSTISGATAAAPLQTVATEGGALTGKPASDGVSAFLGVPFAAPPVGELRWKPPQAAAKWSGVRKADAFGASCVQNQPGSRLPWTEEFMTQGAVSEDCLFLNVWTPASAANAKLPVMFWIYGGGFNEGSGAVAVYDGAALAKKGVVVVSVNYRVGPLGYLAHPELSKESEHKVSGNYGQLDQIAALRWVQANIRAFGGDPAQVTVFGQSAGAISVVNLMRSSLAKGLFARAIAQSGPGLLPSNALGGNTTLADREAAGAKYAEALGAPTLAALRALPASAFFSTAPNAPRPPGGPFRDGWVIPTTDPADQVPLMVGFTADDLGARGGFTATTAPTLANYESNAKRLYGEQTAEFLKLYPAAADGDVTAMQQTAGRDRARVSMHVWAGDQAAASRRVYTYYFDRAIPWPAHPEFGAFHTADVPYVFQTINRLDRPWESVDRQLSDTMSSYWTNFAKKGDPNGAGLPPWPAHDAAKPETMQLGARVGAMPDADPSRLAFLLRALRKS